MSGLNTIQCPDRECAACLAEHRRKVTRRSFFASVFGVGTAMISGLIGMPLIRFVLYPLQGAGGINTWAELGNVSEFEDIATPVLRAITLTQRDGWRETVTEQAVYVSRTAAGELQVLSPVCSHLGCSVAWQQTQTRFVCPCHGGQFDAHGQRLSGPPPRGLDQLDVRVVEGKLQVQFASFRSNVPQKKVLS